MGVEKDTVSLGSTHKQPKCLQKKGKTNKTIIGLITGIGLKNLLLHKEKTPKGQMVSIFTQPHYWGSRKQKKVGDARLPKHINAGHLIYLRLVKHKMLDFQVEEGSQSTKMVEIEGIQTSMKYKKGWDLRGHLNSRGTKKPWNFGFMKHKRAGNLRIFKFTNHENGGKFQA